MASLREMSTPVQMAIAAVVAAAVLSLGYFGVIKTKMEENQVAQVKLDGMKAENDRLRRYEADLPALERKIASLKQQLEIQKQIVPDEKEADKFMHLMQETATNAGVEVRRYTSKGTSTHEYYTELPFEIEVDGSYYGVLNFFERITKLERIISIGGLKMATVTKGSDAGAKKRYQYAPSESVVATAMATTFFSHEPAAPPPAPAKAGKPGTAGAAAPKGK